MTFGKIIKKLRREADITQEQLAETLSISGQAVSRWENDIAMPDISLIPVLANYFNVTSDYLLGIDISKKQERIKSIISIALERGKIGYEKEAAEIIRTGLIEFPENYDLMFWLQHYLYNFARGLAGTERKEIFKEVVNLGEKILEGCTDDSTRHGAIHVLCSCYPEFGKSEKAEKLAWSMPNVYVSCNSLLARIYQGDKRYKAKRDEISLLISLAITRLQQLNTVLDDGKPALTVAEQIEANKKALSLIEMLCENGDYGEYVVTLAEIYRDIFDLLYKSGNIESAFDYLKKAAGITIEFDSSYDKNQKHTSILLRGDEYDDFYYSYTENQSLALLNFLKQKEYFNEINAYPCVEEILSKLDKYATTR